MPPLLHTFFLPVLVLCLSACHSTTSNESHWLEIEGRAQNKPIYRAKVPPHWERVLPDGQAYLKDTMLPIITFLIPNESESLRITVHNFPTKAIEESVSPHAQILRWQKQFESIEPYSMDYNEIAYGGFVGLQFYASGILKGRPTAFLAFAMQLIPEHYRMLSNQPLREEEFKQMRADYTIKAVGHPDAIEQHKDEIIAFAESFELIKPIPSYL
ncbi:Uncharacterized protein PHSC3_001398 [Chlamydiales bacterium STE3]|nr:Uncharacterized protein PHSC3_001398 [Chlamydiales bacterium STE3]